MFIEQKISQVQKLLEENCIEGWLLYDFQRRNPLAVDFLQIPQKAHLTRPFFYWIPQKGDPVKIVHTIESHLFSFLPGKELVYSARQQQQAHVQSLIQGKGLIAMEYSPDNAIPSLSCVDAGTVDFVRRFCSNVVCSGFLLQPFVCVLTKEQRRLHLEAALVLEKVAQGAWDYIAKQMRQERSVSEWDVQNYMSNAMHQQGCIFEGNPICAVNANSSNPHYSPCKESCALIQKGDFVLIDLWCKKDQEEAVYADITRVAIVGDSPSLKQQQVFLAVYEAQSAALHLIQKRCEEKQAVLGWEADRAARSLIEEKGFGPYFVHRTGHNIYTKDHGPGAHLDSLETFDDRPLLAETCFSIEPGIYLPGEFGVRLEYDVYITSDRKVEVSGGIQKEIVKIIL